MKSDNAKTDRSWNRRKVLCAAGIASGMLLLSNAMAADSKKPPEEDEVSPGEDLMREHGVLKRVLLVYRELTRRLETQQEFPLETLAASARVIREFIENYHERLEEDHLFPRFRNAGHLVGLVDVLTHQHQAGRKLTDVIQKLAADGLKKNDERLKLSGALQQFVRMYEPHAAREDTVLFPAFRQLLTAREYDALGETFETREHRLFGQDGYGKMVDRVGTIEQQLGIYELAQFTPTTVGP